MRIRIIKDEATDSVKNGARALPKKEQWETGDVILFYEDKKKHEELPTLDDKTYNDFPIAFEVRDEYSKFATITTFINGVSFGLTKILKALFESHTDISRELLKTPEERAEAENFVKRAFMHKAITEKQFHILGSLYTNEKTKKQLVKEGLCTCEEIDKANERFLCDLEYCYNVEEKRNDDIKNSFYNGEFHFNYTLSEFAQLHEIDRCVLEAVTEALLNGCSVISDDERKFVLSAIKDDGYELTFDIDVKMRIDSVIKKTVKWYEKCEIEFYKAHAELLIKTGNTHIEPIHGYCVANGLCKTKVTACMKMLGVKPSMCPLGIASIPSDCWF